MSLWLFCPCISARTVLPHIMFGVVTSKNFPNRVIYEIWRKNLTVSGTDGRTDGQAGGGTDKVSYRGACYAPKILIVCPFYLKLCRFSWSSPIPPLIFSSKSLGGGGAPLVLSLVPDHYKYNLICYSLLNQSGATCKHRNHITNRTPVQEYS